MSYLNAGFTSLESTLELYWIQRSMASKFKEKDYHSNSLFTKRQAILVTKDTE